MHDSSMKLMRRFAEPLPPGSVLDVGSRDVNGCYRPLFDGWRYVGVDIQPGPNVDRVVKGESWSLGEQFDVVISGQCLEHVRRPWLLMKTMADHLKKGGRMCVIVPFCWDYHPYPIDCWRFAPDGMATIMQDAGLTAVCRLEYAWHPDKPHYKDCIGIATKDGS